MDLLIEKIIEKNNPSVAGLDPLLEYIPEYIRNKAYSEYGKTLKGAAEAIWEFNKALIDALASVVPAIKPQSAYYELYGFEGVRVLEKTIKYAKEQGLYVITDVKRNDIGSTAGAYAKAYLGETDIDGQKIAAFDSDCVTINAYLGSDGLLPFFDYCNKSNKGIFALVKTSNPSSGELQDLQFADGETLYEKAGALIEKYGRDSIGKYGYSNAGAVVGATYPEQLKKIREKFINMFFLIPGYGAQGGGAEGVLGAFDKNGLGGIVNSSRAIMCAYKKEGCDEKDFAGAALREAVRMKNELNLAIKGEIV